MIIPISICCFKSLLSTTVHPVKIFLDGRFHKRLRGYGQRLCINLTLSLSYSLLLCFLLISPFSEPIVESLSDVLSCLLLGLEDESSLELSWRFLLWGEKSLSDELSWSIFVFLCIDSSPSDELQWCLELRLLFV